MTAGEEQDFTSEIGSQHRERGQPGSSLMANQCAVPPFEAQAMNEKLRYVLQSKMRAVTAKFSLFH